MNKQTHKLKMPWSRKYPNYITQSRYLLNEVGDPHFYLHLTKVTQYWTAVQVQKVYI